MCVFGYIFLIRDVIFFIKISLRRHKGQYGFDSIFSHFIYVLYIQSKIIGIYNSSNKKE
jgi:hypothetical protein